MKTTVLSDHGYPLIEVGEGRDGPPPAEWFGDSTSVRHRSDTLGPCLACRRRDDPPALIRILRRDLDMPELSGSRLALLTVAAAVLVGLVYGFVILFVLVMAPLLYRVMS